MSPNPPFLHARARTGRRRFTAAAVAGAGALTALGGLVLPTPALAADDGRVYALGKAADHGAPGQQLAGLAVTPSGTGYWTVEPSGIVHAHGDAAHHGNALSCCVVDIAATPSGNGYWLALSDGGVLALGDAEYLGSMGDKALAAEIVGIAATPSGRGYRLVAADGGIFSFGDAEFLGSMGGTALAAPITAIASTPSGAGYWLAAEDGGVFSFGDAEFRGSAGGTGTTNVTSMAAAPRGLGYWLVGANGDVRAFGSAGDFGDVVTGAAVVDIAPRPQADGVWLATGAPQVAKYRAAAGEPTDADWDRMAQCESSGNWQYRGRYEGGLQFLSSTWLGYGGGEFAQHAYDASREQQIEVARRLWRDKGWGAWPHCSRALGYR